MENIAIGNYLLKLRTERGLTQLQVAEILGVSNKAVSKWECGESLPSVEMLIGLSKLYGVSVDEILKGEGAQKEQKDDCRENRAKPSSKILAPILSIATLLANILSFLLAYLFAFLYNLGAAIWGGLVPLVASFGALLVIHFLTDKDASPALRKAATISFVAASFANFFVVYDSIIAAISTPISISNLVFSGPAMVFFAFLALLPAIPIGIEIARESGLKNAGRSSSIFALIIAGMLAATALEATNDWVNATVIASFDLLLIAAAVTTLIIKKWHYAETVLALAAAIVGAAFHSDFASLLAIAYSVLLLGFSIAVTIVKKKGPAPRSVDSME